MKRYSSLATSLLFALLLTSPATARQADENPPMPDFNMADSDARAVEIADAVMKSMGGRENWDNTRYLSWSFGGDDQVWDKWDGRFRYRHENLVVLMNIQKQEGRAWENGQEITDAEALKEKLSQAYRGWVNSGYWFLMPYKLKDSGVTLKYLGERPMENGRPAEVIQLTFDKVGLTPSNKYEVYVDKETMMVGQWSYFREATDAEPQFTRPWRNWQRYGSIMLSNNRGEGRDGQDFILPNVGVYDTLPESVFTDPAHLDLSTLTSL